MLWASNSVAQNATPAALAINIAQPPTPVPVNGREMLVYEIMLWNTSRDSAELETLDVRDAANGARLASFGASDLGGRLWHPNGAVTPTIAAGEQVAIYVEFCDQLPCSGRIAASLHLPDHRRRWHTQQ